MEGGGWSQTMRDKGDEIKKKVQSSRPALYATLKNFLIAHVRLNADSNDSIGQQHHPSTAAVSLHTPIAFWTDWCRRRTQFPCVLVETATSSRRS